MTVGVDRGRRAPAPTNDDDAATEADFVCVLRRCVLLLAHVTAMGLCLSMPAEPWKNGVRGVVCTAHGMVFVCCNATALAVSVFILLRLQSKVLGTEGVRYSQLQFIVILDVLCLIGAYSAARVKTAILLVSLMVVALLYIAIQVLLFQSKPVGRLLLLPHVQETPPRKCQNFQKRRQQTMVVSTQGKVEVDDIIKSMILFLALFTSMVYEVTVGPLPSAALGDAGTRISNTVVRELVYFHWNDTSSVASLVLILLHALCMEFSKQRILYRVLQAAMTLDMFILVAAFASRNCLQLPTFVYISVLAPVSLYAGIMSMASMSEMFPTCTAWRRVLKEKMEEYCVPNWLNKSFDLPTNEHTEDTWKTGWNLEDMRQFVSLLAIGAANLSTIMASTSLSPSLLLENMPGHVVNRAFHSNEFYVGNLTEQAGMSSLPSLWPENTSAYVIGNQSLAFYCYAAAFTGSLAIIVLLANKKLSSRVMHCYVRSMFVVACVSVLADERFTVDVFKHASIFLFTIASYVISSRGPRKTVKSILGWLQHTFQVDPSGEEGSEEELEFGLAGGGMNGEPVAVEISAPVLGGALTLVLAIPVMRMLASPLKMVLAFFVASIGADLWRRLLARLQRALAMILHHRRNPGQGSVPAAFGTTSSGWNGWYMILATCNGLCKVIRALCSKACVWILVFVIWFPSLMPNLKLKFKIPKISALVVVLIALATTATTTTTVDSPTTEITATEMSTLTTAMTTSGTSSRSRKHPPRVEQRPRRSCRPNKRLIGEEWVN